jgi:magnesium transporter
MRDDLEKTFEQVQEALRTDNSLALHHLVEELHPADLAECYRLLDDELRSQLIFLLPSRKTAEVIAQLDEQERGEVVEEISNPALSEIVTELAPDDAADVLGELPEEQREKVLELMPVDQADQLEELLEHDEESAGGIMTPELVALPATATVGEAIEEVRRMSEDEEIHYVYVVDDDRRLLGLVPLRRLVVNPKHVPLEKICERDPVAVHVDDDQEHVANIIRKYDISAVPVLDVDGRLIGRVTHDDVADVAEEEAAEDIFYMAGTEAAELEEASITRAAVIRMRWLILCLAGTVVSATVVALFRGSFPIEVYAALFLFVPMMGAMGGNSGIQISTIIVRSLATGELESTRIGRDLARELPITLLMAPSCGLLAATIARVGLPLLDHFTHGIDPSISINRLSLAVGLGMTAAILSACVLGMSLPHLFRKIGIDPAIASGPVVTTGNDIISMTIYFTIGLMVMR